MQTRRSFTAVFGQLNGEKLAIVTFGKQSCGENPWERRRRRDKGQTMLSGY